MYDAERGAADDFRLVLEHAHFSVADGARGAAGADLHEGGRFEGNRVLRGPAREEPREALTVA